MSFDATKADLADILRQAQEGRIQLPDFQRSYVWGDGDVRALIASIARGFPVGALLTLRNGGEVRFRPRTIKGAPQTDHTPEILLLDGQQRITSLYQALFSPTPVRTRKNDQVTVDRHYYLDMRKALAKDGDMEDAVIGVPADRVVRRNFGREVVLDLSSRDAEIERAMFPLDQTFDITTSWLFGWMTYWGARDPAMIELGNRFNADVLNAIKTYKMPVIELGSSNGREAICLIFEKVNVGGKKLDAFELVTAIFAGDGFDLREDWAGRAATRTEPARPGRHDKLLSLANGGRRETLTGVSSVDFLQACTVLQTREVRARREAEGATGLELPQVSMRRDALLKLPLEAYERHANAIQEGFGRAAAFLGELRILRERDVPYPPQITALASFFAARGNAPLSAPGSEKLARWFWTVALGEVYGSATETRIARDVTELLAWIDAGGPKPRVVVDTVFREERLMSLRTRNSAAYVAAHALLMAEGCRDFVTGQPVEIMTFHDAKIDIHHIFPKAWCIARGHPREVYDSIVNKTALSKASNQSIGGKAPSDYLARIERGDGQSPAALDAILASHLIDPALVRADDFEGFVAARRTALGDLVGRVMDHVVRNAPAEEAEYAAPVDLEEEAA